jgi:hypothetical protein
MGKLTEKWIDVQHRMDTEFPDVLSLTLSLERPVIPWVTGNSKLVKTMKVMGKKVKVIGFGTLADVTFKGADGKKRNTCPSAGTCRSVCFGKQGMYIQDNVINARMRALAALEHPKFVEQACADLEGMAKRMRAKEMIVRVNDVGDLYSRDVIAKWKAIRDYCSEKKLPIKFYAYTKSLSLPVMKDLHGPTFPVTQSLAGHFDHRVDRQKPHSRIFPTECERVEAGYVDGMESDLPAINGVVKIGLTYHGTRKLTAEEAEKLRAI